MMNIRSFLFLAYVLIGSPELLIAQTAGDRQIPIASRVDIQTDTVKISEVVDGCWAAVGIDKPYAIQHDYSLLFNGKPSYYFELKGIDNTLWGYFQGEEKGRAELAYCYATAVDFSRKADLYEQAQRLKNVHHYGKGISPQGSSREYEFSVYIPSSLSSKAAVAFAQWQGMPDHTVVRTPEGKVKQLTPEQLISVESHTIFKKSIGYEKVFRNGTYRAGRPNGWRMEQGGASPLAFGFSDGWFYIKANSDRKWMSDKSDRCDASPSRNEVMRPVSSEYKTSTIAYKLPFDAFPKDCWVTFRIHIDWTVYGGVKENIVKPGQLDVHMYYKEQRLQVDKHIVKNREILVGRNDNKGYYFKFGIYRLNNSMIPVSCNLAGYSEK